MSKPAGNRKVLEIEQIEIRDFIRKCAPFNELDDEMLDRVTVSLEIIYRRAGEILLDIGDKNDKLFLVRKGTLDIFDPEGNLHNRIEAGDWTGYRSLLEHVQVYMKVTMIEDTLLYLVPGPLFLEICEKYEGIRDYFAKKKALRLRKAIQQLRGDDNNSLVASHVRDLMYGKPLVVGPGVTIRDAAQLMTDRGVTAMLVMDGDRLAGIVTERAYCTHVAAKALPLDRPIADIMTSNLITISADTLGSDALLTMARHHVRHLPVMDRGQVVGLITATDLIRRQSHNTLYIINQIHRAVTIEELSQLSSQLPAMLVALVSASLSAYDTAHAISSVGEAITQRLIKMARAELGEPPVKFAWIAAGSLARFEQTVHSDQDNGIIFANDYDEAQHGDYFRRLSKFVSDGLDKCGYEYCPGNVMATNDQWRQPLARWKRYFDSWINTPEKKSLMYVSIFFDLRCICGECELLHELQQEVAKKAKANSIFLTYMAANALQYKPPLGFFRNFVIDKSGSEESGLEMKKRGVTPIVDLARVHALASGLTELNTRDRLEAAAKAGALSQTGMEDLVDAYEFISAIRLQHQMHQVRAGLKPDNLVPPAELSTLDRRHLKDAFDVVNTLQSALEKRFQTERIG